MEQIGEMEQTSILSQKDIDLLNKVKDYGLTKFAYNFYAANFRGGSIDTYETIRKKLIRNIVLAEKAPMDKKDPEGELYYYGSMSIFVSTKDKNIIWLAKNTRKGWFFLADRKKKQELNKILEISN